MTCDNSWLAPMAGSAYMLGMTFGAIIIGDLSDRFGRKLGFLVSILLMAGGGLICAASVNNIMFLIFRFLSGAGGVGLYQVTYIIGM